MALPVWAQEVPEPIDCTSMTGMLAEVEFIAGTDSGFEVSMGVYCDSFLIQLSEILNDMNLLLMG